MKNSTSRMLIVVGVASALLLSACASSPADSRAEGLTSPTSSQSSNAGKDIPGVDGISVPFDEQGASADASPSTSESATPSKPGATTPPKPGATTPPKPGATTPPPAPTTPPPAPTTPPPAPVNIYQQVNDYCATHPSALGSASSPSGLLGAANTERAKFGLGALSWSDSLASSSVGWSQQMVANDAATPPIADALAHNPNRPAGGENVAMSYSSGGLSEGSAMNKAHSGWMASVGHCGAILNPDYTQMGAGGAMTEDGTTWYTTANYR